MQGQLRQMRGVQELDIVMVRAWEYVGLGLFEAIALWPEEEPLLPALKTIRLTAHRQWFKPGVGCGEWWSQLCDVVSQRRRCCAVRVELIGDFCACRNGQAAEAGVRKLIKAGAKLDLSRAAVSFEAAEWDAVDQDHGKVVLRCHCN